MEPQYQTDKKGNVVEVTSKAIDVSMLIGELNGLNARRDEIIAILSSVQALPNLNTEIVSKIQEVPEFASIEVTPVSKVAQNMV